MSFALKQLDKERLLDTYDTFLFDADGVLWRGDTPVRGAIPFVDCLLKAVRVYLSERIQLSILTGKAGIHHY